MSKQPCFRFNKSVLNWTFCQLLRWKFEALDCPAIRSKVWPLDCRSSQPEVTMFEEKPNCMKIIKQVARINQLLKIQNKNTQKLQLFTKIFKTVSIYISNNATKLVGLGEETKWSSQGNQIRWQHWSKIFFATIIW